jgi:hypothetical protein
MAEKAGVALSPQAAVQAMSERREPEAVDASMPDEQARQMFGCTATTIDEALARCREPRDVARYAMGTLSNAQELIRRSTYEGTIEWSVDDRHANTIRQLMNVAKYAIDKAVPR